MLEIKAKPFVRAIEMICALRSHIIDKDNMVISAIVMPAFIEHLENLNRDCTLLNAPLTKKQTKRAIRYLRREKPTFGGIKEYVEVIRGRLIDELDEAKFFFLSSEYGHYYEIGADAFGPEVIRAFPSLHYEIDEAAKALAMGRSTASAFHTLRCLEAAIRAISRCLGISDPTKGAERSWSIALEKIREATENKWPKSKRVSGDGPLFEKFHAILTAMQNPYRNTTMHLDAKYTEAETDHLIVMVRGLLESVASRMDENGDPKI